VPQQPTQDVDADDLMLRGWSQRHRELAIVNLVPAAVVRHRFVLRTPDA
jgi:hypothetical protein